MNYDIETILDGWGRNAAYYESKIKALESILIAIILNEQIKQNNYTLGLRVYDRDKIISPGYELTFTEDKHNRCTVINIVDTEKIRKQALAKLTPQEIEILGVS